MSMRVESCSDPGTTRTAKIRPAGRSPNVICLPSENSKTSRFGRFNILKTASVTTWRLCLHLVNRPNGKSACNCRHFRQAAVPAPVSLAPMRRLTFPDQQQDCSNRYCSPDGGVGGISTDVGPLIAYHRPDNSLSCLGCVTDWQQETRGLFLLASHRQEVPKLGSGTWHEVLSAAAGVECPKLKALPASTLEVLVTGDRSLHSA